MDFQTLPYDVLESYILPEARLAVLSRTSCPPDDAKKNLRTLLLASYLLWRFYQSPDRLVEEFKQEFFADEEKWCQELNERMYGARITRFEAGLIDRDDDDDAKGVHTWTSLVDNMRARGKAIFSPLPVPDHKSSTAKHHYWTAIRKVIEYLFPPHGARRLKRLVIAKNESDGTDQLTLTKTDEKHLKSAISPGPPKGHLCLHWLDLKLLDGQEFVISECQARELNLYRIKFLQMKDATLKIRDCPALQRLALSQRPRDIGVDYFDALDCPCTICLENLPGLKSVSLGNASNVWPVGLKIQGLGGTKLELNIIARLNTDYEISQCARPKITLEQEDTALVGVSADTKFFFSLRNCSELKRVSLPARISCRRADCIIYNNAFIAPEPSGLELPQEIRAKQLILLTMKDCTGLAELELPRTLEQGSENKASASWLDLFAWLPAADPDLEDTYNTCVQLECLPQLKKITTSADARWRLAALILDVKDCAQLTEIRLPADLQVKGRVRLQINECPALDWQKVYLPPWPTSQKAVLLYRGNRRPDVTLPRGWRLQFEQVTQPRRRRTSAQLSRLGTVV